MCVSWATVLTLSRVEYAAAGAGGSETLVNLCLALYWIRLIGRFDAAMPNVYLPLLAYAIPTLNTFIDAPIFYRFGRLQPAVPCDSSNLVDVCLLTLRIATITVFTNYVFCSIGLV